MGDGNLVVVEKELYTAANDEERISRKTDSRAMQRRKKAHRRAARDQPDAVALTLEDEPMPLDVSDWFQYETPNCGEEAFGPSEDKDLGKCGDEASGPCAVEAFGISGDEATAVQWGEGDSQGEAVSRELITSVTCYGTDGEGEDSPAFVQLHDTARQQFLDEQANVWTSAILCGRCHKGKIKLASVTRWSEVPDAIRQHNKVVVAAIGRELITAWDLVPPDLQRNVHVVEAAIQKRLILFWRDIPEEVRQEQGVLTAAVNHKLLVSLPADTIVSLQL
eukprot:TRINITY_DN20276_c0_g2_i1.p1 TRINITY_DN20276_c0_g2~~TRINITY_DN20276_c0_g2_i1.p1  ORF type:complete len:278 (+),score=34.71 TRINITY_DN20276_c0_g2_i1:224-1057(+)